MDFETEAIVLKRFDFGDTSQVAHLLTAREGRVSVLAKGVKKPNPTLKGPIDLFHFARVKYRRRRGAELALLTRYEPITGFPDLRRSLERLYSAFYLTELFHVVSPEGDADPAVFALLGRALEALEEADIRSVPAVTVATELGFLERAGFAPPFDRCALCGARLRAGPTAFYESAGGFICEACPRPVGEAQGLSAGTRALLTALGRAGPRHAVRYQVAAGQLRELRAIMKRLVGAVLERPLRSEPFLREIRSPVTARRPTRSRR